MLGEQNLAPIIVPADTVIPQALQMALSREPHLIYEPLIVRFGKGKYRMLDIYTLLIAQSKLFEDLQKELQLINAELEARVQERTSDLLRINNDLTEEIDKRMLIEQALTQARDEAVAASRLKSELLAKVSHELRTPLGAILGYTEMIQVGVYGSVSADQTHILGRIINSTHHLTNVVGQILDQAQIEAGRLTLHVARLNTATILNESLVKVSVLAQEKGLTLTSQIEPDVPLEIKGDSTRLKQILVNLISNGLKFTESGGVHVRIFRPDETQWAIAVFGHWTGDPP